MAILTFKISEEDTNRIEGIYSDLTAYKSILAEMSNSSNTSDIGSTKTYSVFKELNKKYAEVADEIISKVTDGKYGSNSSWKINFKDSSLTIYDHNEDNV